jgi:hypothetical protein
VGGEQVGAIWRAIDGDFAARAAANGADGFALRGTEPRAFSLFTDRTLHGSSLRIEEQKEYAARVQKTKDQPKSRRR